MHTRLIVAILLVLAGSTIAVRPGPAHADAGYDATYPATLGAGRPSGQLRLAHTDTVTPSVNVALTPNPSIDWGDGSSSEAQVEKPCVHCYLSGNHTYARPGTYTIHLRYYTGAAVHYDTTTTATVVPVTSGFTIVSIGDSNASGEGNPDVPLSFQGPALWDDGTGGPNGTSHCHRSHYAGSVLAAGVLQGQNPGTNVNFLFLACTGSQIVYSQDEQKDVIHQLQTAAAQLHGQHIDALVISIGANDIGFASIIYQCAGDFVPSCDQDTSLQATTDASFAALPGRYAQLAQAIDALDVGQVYLEQYFDPTHGFDGDYCPSSFTLGVFTYNEWRWAHDHVVVPLNQAVSDAAQRYGWHLVDGVASAFQDHGYCAKSGLTDQNWVVRAEQSILQQGDQNGSFHANHLGHQLYRDRILATLNQFQTASTSASATVPASSGTSNPVSPSAVPSETDSTTGGQSNAQSANGAASSANSTTDGTAPYTFGTMSSGPVTLTLTRQESIGVTHSGSTYVGVDRDCSRVQCSAYSGPITISTPGQHSVSFYSTNNNGGSERVHSVNVDIAGSLSASASATTADGRPYVANTPTRQDVTVSFTCTPGNSPVVAVTTPITVSTEGRNQSASGSCHDTAGESASATFDGIFIDKTVPRISFMAAKTADGRPYRLGAWTNQPVTLTWTCADALSGSVSPTVSRTVGTEGAGQAATGSCVDRAGNSASDTRKGIDIDRTAPVTTATPDTHADPTGAYHGPVTITLSGTDGGSGVATTEYQLDGGAWAPYAKPILVAVAGDHTLRYRSTDRTGNREAAKGLTMRILQAAVPS